MTEKTIGHAFNLDTLPTLPSVAMEALRLMEGENSSFDSIAELLKNDQVLTGKILHYANSAHVGARREIDTISHAISAAGFNAVRSIILSVSIFDTFSAKMSPDREKLVHFWLHSIGVAATAEALARHLDFPSPEKAYLGGLLHDLGKLVFYQQYPEIFSQVCRELEQYSPRGRNQMLPLDTEQAIAGFNHIDAGKIIGERYGFPEILTRSMWLHHQPVIEPISPDLDHLPQLIRFADVLCVTHNVGSSYFLTEKPVCHDHFHFALENLVRLHHFTPEDINAIMAEVHKRVEEVCKILGFWNEEDYQKLLRSANVSLGKMSMQLDENNQILFAANQVLTATCDMYRKLHAGLSLGEAAEVVADSVCQALDVKRCLCLIRDPVAHRFVGSLADDHVFHDITLPSRLADMTGRRNYATDDIEIEAANRLEQVTHDLLHGRIEESRMFSMMTGSKFLATFFMADKKSRWRKEQLLGQLVVDCSSGPDFIRNGFAGLQKNFEALASSAGTAIERLLLQQDVNRQARKLAESSRKMEENQRQLFSSHRLATVGRLAAGAAHEINNPLTIISLNMQILKRLIKQVPDSEMLAERLRIISDQETRISNVIQDLMRFAKPTEPKFCPVHLTEIVANALNLVESRESITNIRIDNQLGKNLPQIMVDPQQIEQVFLNLFVNACQAMPDGGVLSIKPVNVDDDFIEIAVSDTGTGIAKKDLNKIFDPFFTTKLEGEGTGLGLAVCHAIIEHNMGALRVESTEGQGASFLVRLPQDKSGRLRQMKKILQTRKKQDTAAATQEKSKILVVDDERILNEILQETLRSAGYAVDGAYDGVEGLEKLRHGKYHVVLLDIRMPRKDGLAVLEFIKREYPEVQVIIITGLASLAEIKETVKKGAFACLKKPFMLDKVLETIERAVIDQKCKISP
ncbi:MAG: HDOD domain-containing protein [Deltaproteobacteria bacterium]|nr:HDOD domain-containing protein [Deltaproteobacteria bacterium]